jgi:hypothetical protein
MLENSPPLPIIIDHNDEDHDLTTTDESGIMLALQHRNRIRRIRLYKPGPSLQKVVMAIEEDFPILEHLSLGPPMKHDTPLVLPSTFEAPQLPRLVLNHFAFPSFSLFMTGLVSITLQWIHPSTYLLTHHLLQSLSQLPHLERLQIGFRSPAPSCEIKRQLWRAPINTPFTFPNLHFFRFDGVSTYLEALLPLTTTPRLQRLALFFFHQLIFSAPRLLQFMTTTEGLSFTRVKLVFHHKAVNAFVYPSAGSGSTNFEVRVLCDHLDWQVSSMAQIFNHLWPLLSGVIDLTLDYREHMLSSESHNEADPTQWHEFLGPLKNLKTLRVHKGLVEQLARSLRRDGELPVEVLPKLEELVCPTEHVGDNMFTGFIHEREIAGQPVNLIGEPFPVGHTRYEFDSSTGTYYVGST